MASRSGDVPDGRAVPISGDKKITGTNSKNRDISSMSKDIERLSLFDTENVRDQGGKNKAEIERQPPERPRPARRERLEDVFQDEIVRRFPKMSEFKKFARSHKGLQLPVYDVENIMEDYRSGEEQRIQMLFRWSQKLGSGATPQRIRDILEDYYAEDEEEDD